MNIFMDSGKETVTFIIADNIISDLEVSYCMQIEGLRGYLTVSEDKLKRFTTGDSISCVRPIRQVTTEEVCSVVLKNFSDKY